MICLILKGIFHFELLIFNYEAIKIIPQSKNKPAENQCRMRKFKVSIFLGYVCLSMSILSLLPSCAFHP